MQRHFAILAAVGIGMASSALALNEPKNSTVDVQAKDEGGKLQFTFKITPNEGHVVTLDAPWSLELGGDNLAFEKTKLKKPEMDDKIPGFVVATTGAPKSATGDLTYKLVSFICKKDKTACYREIHEGKYGWKTAAK